MKFSGQPTGFLESILTFFSSGIRADPEQYPKHFNRKRKLSFERLVVFILHIVSGDTPGINIKSGLFFKMARRSGTWHDARHRAFKLHIHFELLKGVPVRMDLTDGNGDERQALAAGLQPDRVYVLDSGYVKFNLFRDILDIGSSLVCVVYDNTIFEVIEERALSDDARQAGIVRDVVVRFTGPSAIKAGLDRPVRRVEVKCKPHRKTSVANV